MFAKITSDPLEGELLHIASSYGFAPKIRDIDGNIINMDTVDGATIADIYGDDPANVPDDAWEQIVNILTTLFEQEGIEYIDITSYNFMKDSNGKVWIIDFGHACYTSMKEGEDADNWFLRSVIKGESGKAWNPDYT
jgi:RIO-like serine/threonine protein kinase